MAPHTLNEATEVKMAWVSGWLKEGIVWRSLNSASRIFVSISHWNRTWPVVVCCLCPQGHLGSEVFYERNGGFWRIDHFWLKDLFLVLGVKFNFVVANLFLVPIWCILTLYLKEFFERDVFMWIGSASHNLMDLGMADFRRACDILAGSMHNVFPLLSHGLSLSFITGLRQE
jgi:hypothetical protein